MASQTLKIISSLLLLPLLVSISIFFLNAEAIGVNWGTAASHPLPPQKVVELLKSNGIDKVKLIDTDPLVLESLSGSNIHVTVSIPNFMLRTLNSSTKAADSWVHNNLSRFVSDGASRVLIDYLAIGDEPFLQSYGDQFYPFVLGAALNIQAALTKAKFSEKVKLVIPCSYDTFQSESGLPSKAQFRPDINRTMIDLLTFLNRNQAPLFVTISPFQNVLENKNISLDFALFRETAHRLNDTNNSYKNSFDLNFNTITTAISAAGFSQMDIIIGKIGWPTDGSTVATSQLAEEFTKGLINHIHNKPSTKFPTETYIFSLLDEDNRSISAGGFERHWGIFTFDGQAKYDVDFGQRSKKLVNAENVEYLSSRWCVVNNNKDISNGTTLGLKGLEACSAADCTEVSPGGSCFNLSWPGNVSYAFNNYYQQHDQNAWSCDFGGLGLITTVDPSVGSCRFLVGLKTSSAILIRESVCFGWMAVIVLSILFCLVNGIL